MKWASWMNFALGVWLFFAPITLAYASVKSALYEDLILGSVIAGFALWRALGPETDFMALVSWVVAAAGFWVVLAPFELGYGSAAVPVYNDVTVGVAVLVLAIWRALSHPEGGMPHMAAHH